MIAVTSVAASLSTIRAGLAVFGDRLGKAALVVGLRPAKPSKKHPGSTSPA